MSEETAEIIERLKTVQQNELRDALGVCRRLARHEEVEDGELLDAFFTLVARLDITSPILPIAVEILKRYMDEIGELETPAGVKREWLNGDFNV